MKLRRVLGFFLLVAAAVGFVFSIIGQIEIWRYYPVVTRNVTETLVLFDQTFKTTLAGLTVVGQIVDTTTADISSLQTTTSALAKTIHDTNPMLDSLTILAGKDLPASIVATQTSLASAQSSALFIDNALAALTSLPFLPVASYKPTVPLHTALADVSASMNSLAPSLTTITSSLADGKTNLSVVEAELNSISETTKGISTALKDAKTVIEQYKAVTTQIQGKVTAAQLVAPGWVTKITVILSFLLGWLLIAQVGLCVQGLDMLRNRREV